MEKCRFWQNRVGTLHITVFIYDRKRNAGKGRVNKNERAGTKQLGGNGIAFCGEYLHAGLLRGGDRERNGRNTAVSDHACAWTGAAGGGGNLLEEKS